MAKTKKPRSPKQLANDQRLRDEAAARRAAKEATEKADPVEHKPAEPQSRIQPVPEGVELPKRKVEVPEDQPEAPVEPTNPEVAALMQMMKNMQLEMDQLKAANAGVERSGQDSVRAVAEMSGATVGRQGVQGRVFIYPVEKSHYPDPTQRLYDEPTLKRFALRENFYFKWDVTGETYELHGVTYTEPRFMVELWRYLFDEETGEPTGEMFLVNRQYQHEDELIARVAADKLGYKIGEGEKFATLQDLMDEMRYYRIRQWLLDVFKPFKAHQHKNKKVRQRVIGGKVVEVTDSEEVVDGNSGIATAEGISSATELTPAEIRAFREANLLN